MNFIPDEANFLAHYQTLLFSDKLINGTPSEKADVLRNAISQLQYARISKLTNNENVSKLLTEYQDTYSNIVDSFDEKTGLNNYAEGALNLCSGHKNESQSWTSSLTVDGMLKIPGIQQLIKDIKASKENVLPSSHGNDKLPISKPSIQQITNLLNSRIGIPTCDTQPSKTDSRKFGNNGASSVCPVMNVYGNNSRNQTRQEARNQEKDWNQSRNLDWIQEKDWNHSREVDKNQKADWNMLGQSAGNQENQFKGGFGSNPTHRNDDYQIMGRKPLFTSGGRTNAQPWQNSRGSTPYGQNNDNYGSSKRKMNEDADDYENDKPSMAGSAFRTAKQQLVIDNQKKYGGGGPQQNRSSMNNVAYGTGKKSLGPRRGLNSKFVPPVMNREDSDTDGNQATNTITRAVLKTGGNDNTGVKYEGLDEEKLKGIEPKMIELIMNEIMDTGQEMTWDDIAGLQFAKKTIKEIVVWPMLRPDIFTGLRGPPKGLLLFGPPGTGKTLIGKCIASQSKSTFFCISASSLTSKWVGEGEKMVRALFAVARAQQPAVVFIDEIDSLLTQRTDGENEASRRIKTEFLVQLDGASTSSDDRILVIGATNRPQEIDEAARRRFVKRLYIPLPEDNARNTIIINLLKKQSHSLEENQLEMICSRTDGFSGADMATLCREAALGPIRDMSFGDIEHISADQVRPIQFCDFEEALQTVRPSVSDKDLDLYLQWNKTFGSGSR